MTLGARVVALRGNAVMLVKQSYTTGWILPGGGVERGETLLQAAIREVREEAGLVAEGPLQLHGIFANEAKFRGDHVACFIMREFAQVPWAPDLEISDAKFFPSSSLPADVTDGSRRRINEILNGAPIADQW